jgi:phenylacetate-CoA ligase
MATKNKLELEQCAQQEWVAHNAAAINPVVDRLLEREFLLPKIAGYLEEQELARILNFARDEVPWYGTQEAWSKLPVGKRVLGREVLLDLPVTSKFDVQNHNDDLLARRFPKGHEPYAVTSSSGTTGKPTKVIFSRPVAGMFGFFLQRQMRWFRVNPAWKKAFIRLPKNIPVNADGEYLRDGEVYRAQGWMNIAHLFKTGPTVGFSRHNPTEEKLKWLRLEKPDYFMSFPGSLESLVLAAQGKPVETLKAVRTISATLTPGMRRRIESASGLHPQQNYGLNEIGIVALRCPDGRYHVNSEYCIVEILDQDQQPCAPGQTGRIIVTALTNFAMPLIRYDTGDLGVAVEGDCPCGRTSPGFAEVIGRYRPMHLAPEGTALRVQLITDVIDKLPLQALAGLREYQIHQFRDNCFELRLVIVGEPGLELTGSVRAAWDQAFGPDSPLKICQVDRIPTLPGGKQQEFSSDFFPAHDK